MTTLSTLAQNQITMEEQIIALPQRSAQISYIKEGTGDQTLLFLHGWCIDKSYFEHQIEFFKNKYTVYAMDNAGFGNSTAERNEWTIENYAKDVLAFINALNLKNVVLIGHSMSGEIILETALIGHPEIKGIIGIDNFKFIDVQMSEEQMNEFMAFMPLLEKDFKNVAPSYADNFLFHVSTPPAIKDRIKTDFANADPQVGYSSLMHMFQYAATEAEKLEQLQFPLHIIGNDAMPTNLEGLENRCKNGYRLREVHATGHYPMIEKPDETNVLLTEAVEEIFN